MERIQMFDTPHKALRLAFSELLTLAGKTDFAQTIEIRTLKEKMRDVFSMVKSHSHHEDDVCFADLDQLVPNATQHDRTEHIRLHHVLDTLIIKINTINEGVQMGLNESVAGRTLYTELCNLHAEILIHMMEEERDTQPVFWKYMTDEQIAGFEPRILASMTPEMSALWMRYIIPTQPHEMLLGMFRGMKANAPFFVFEANMNLAKEVLPANAFEKLQDIFEPAFA